MKDGRMNMLAFLLCLMLCADGLAGLAYWGATNAAIMEALDLKEAQGISLVKQEWIHYKYNHYGIETNEDGTLAVKSSQEIPCWTVQMGNFGQSYDFPLCKGVSPLKGTTCIRSSLQKECTEDNDAQSVRLTFKVSSGGTLRFSFLLSANSTDIMNVYLDSKKPIIWRPGTNPVDLMWGVIQENETLRINEVELQVPAGLAPEGSTYAGTYNHEIVFEFMKSAPFFKPEFKPGSDPTWIYSPSDMPIMPDLGRFDLSNPFQREEYYLQMARFYGFQNCMWLDDFTWTPVEMTLRIGPGDQDKELIVVGEDSIHLENNSMDFGGKVHYTLDGTRPTLSSPQYKMWYSEDGILMQNAVALPRSCTVTAMMFTADGEPLEQTLVSRKITLMCADPEVKFSSISDDRAMVEIQVGSHKDYEIRYDLGGRSHVYQGPFAMTEAGTLKVSCHSAGKVPSKVVELTLEQVQAPVTYEVRDQLGFDEKQSCVYAGDVGLRVSSGDANQYSLDSRKTWSSYDGAKAIVVKAPKGATEASIYFRNREDGKLASAPLRVTVYRASEAWSLGDSENSDASGTVMKNGWNMFSVPMLMPMLQWNMFKQVYGEGLFVFDSKSQCYRRFDEAVDIPKPSTAYFFFKQSNQSLPLLSLEGILPGDYSVGQLRPGWHGYGAVKNESVPDGIIAWQLKNGCYEQVKSFQRGQGYFIYKAP